ncbi:uncharacterized protein TNCV_4731681 [Trichonephila clavipes]|nr:uncharacterized protein TNCV_4731681 [Trichonephila clavipes]
MSFNFDFKETENNFMKKFCNATNCNGTQAIEPSVGAVCRCKAKTGLRRSPRGLHIRTRLSSLLRFNLDFALRTAWFHFGAVSLLVRGATLNGGVDGWLSRAAVIPNALRMVQEDTGTPNEATTCAWRAADEAVGCTRAFLIMWRSSRRLVCRGALESGLHVNGISCIHCFQHLLRTQSGWTN